MKKTVFGFLLLGGLSFLSSCRHQPENPPPPPGPTNPPVSNACHPDTVYFVNTILPILSSNCALSGCHDANTMQDGINLSSYAGVMSSGVIKLSDPWSSDLLEAVTETDPDDIMPPPPANPLTPQQINALYTWISQGAQNNACQSACDTTVFTFSGAVSPIIQARCEGCHSGGNPQGGILLTNYDQIKVQALNGKLFGTVSHANGFVPMPFGGNKIPDCEITQIKKWIDNGALNN